MLDRSMDLVDQTSALLEPGEIDLVGIIVETGLSSDADVAMTEATIEVGETIATNVTDEPTYIYSGNDDTRFASNQHQGLTIEDDAFVWECQQLLVEGTFTLVFYFEAAADTQAIVETLKADGYETTLVRP